MSLLSGWRLALRLAWREAWRAKGRSALVLVMVTFPVVAVVAADVAQATASVSAVEGLDRQLGSAQAEVTSVPGAGSLIQLPDPSSAGYVPQSGGGRHPAPTLSQVVQALGGTRPATELRNASAAVRTDAGGVGVTEQGVDLADPLTRGLYRLTSGRLATRSGEVDINAALASYGFGIGDTLPIGRGETRTVVGIAESEADRTQPLTIGPLADVPGGARRFGTRWLVGGAPVTWDDVRAVNAVGAMVLSRDVIEHPPSLSTLPPQARASLVVPSNDTQTYTILALIGVMVLIEVVLLAGPAFAVGARRQSRNLALIAANGGTPVQSRRTILASAVVLGSVGAVVGVVLGILLGRVLVPVLQNHSDQWFGPFQIRWDHVAVVALFGLLSALLAAVVPAWIASRQDVVAVLGGRRGDRKASLRSPVAGVVLLGVGVVLATMGARRGAGDLLIAVAAVVSVFGMIFLVPVVVVTVARLGRGFPLSLRYAVRDAARHRTRTVPAVAAVAATVAGVVALSIANTSDQAQAKAEYVPQLPIGMSGLSASGENVDWAGFAAAVRQEAPSSRINEVTGVVSSRFWDIGLVGRNTIPAGTTSNFPSPVLVDDGHGEGLATLLGGIVSREQVSRAQAALEKGSVVVFSDQPTAADRVELSVGSGRHRQHGRFPATYVVVSGGRAPSQAIVPPSVVRRLGEQPSTVGLLVSGPTLTHEQEKRIDEVVFGMDRNSYLYVERGYQVPSREKVVLWLLFGLAGILMLGGTLTATFLALSDARPDLATLSAVGAAPRTRRAVAAAYALSVGVVGAALGAAVGFIPGVAVSYPLTRTYDTTGLLPSHYLDIPWLLIVGLVVLLPTVTAVVVGLTARSRLPLVARLD